MERLPAVALCSALVALGAAGYRLIAAPASSAPRKLAPFFDEVVFAPAPEPPAPREDAPEERAIDFVRRYIDRVRAAVAERAHARVESEIVGALDTQAFARASLGNVWGALSEAQRAAAARDLQAITVTNAAKHSAAWIGGGPRVTTVKDEGANARVTTLVRDGRDEIEIVFVMSRGPDGWRVVDLVTEGVSASRSYRSQVERLLVKHGGDPAPLLARLSAKAALGGDRRAPRVP